MPSTIISHEYTKLEEFITKGSYSSIFLLTDANTSQHCRSRFMAELSAELPIHEISIPSGEIHKTLSTCDTVWQALIDGGADRKSLLINLGGGVVTDLGGFVAATYKRGIDFLHVPTSLLAMVDAAIGGKTGVDFNTIKNCIGTITPPKMVFVDVAYLKTLPKSQFNSGMAEVIKHGLITSKTYYNAVVNFLSKDEGKLENLIKGSVEIKEDVVAKDPYEKGLRKTLNFGHTLGHAIESYFLENQEHKTLLHGEAIGYGMLLECFLSHKQLGFPLDTILELAQIVHQLHGTMSFTSAQINAIIDLMKYDKKNTAGKVNFVLLKAIGEPIIDCNVSNDDIYEAFNFYKKI